MDEPSRAQKWATVIVMGAVTVAVSAWIATHVPEFRQAAAAHGYDESIAYGWVAGTIVAIAFAAWLATLVVCGLIQRTSSVWLGGPFFAFLAVVTLVAGFAGPQMPDAIAAAKYRWFRTPGEVGLQAARETYVAQRVQNDSDCQHQLDVLGFPDFLHPASLGAPHGVERAQAKTRKARDIIETYRAHDNARVTKFRKSVEALDLPAEIKAEALSGVGTEAENLRNRLYVITAAIVDEAEAALTDLAAHRSKWTTDGDKLMFYDKKDLAAFRVHTTKLAALNNQGKALSKKLAAMEKDKTRYTVLIKTNP